MGEYMEITGFASEFVIGMRIDAHVRRIFEAVKSLWPSLYFCSQRADLVDISLWRASLTESEVIGFSRDREMEEYWDQFGYDLMPDGQGPFAIAYTPFGGVMLNAKIDSAAHAPREILDVVPRDCRLLLGAGYLVSLITPEDPSEDPFCRHVNDLFIQAFFASQSE